MPDKMVALLIRFLEQGNGLFSKRVKTKELRELTKEEFREIEDKYQQIFQ
jgi:hypothetical protein